MNAEDHTAEIMDALMEAQRVGMAFSPELLTALLEKEIKKITEQEHKALALWREWFEKSGGEPSWFQDGGMVCFFCDEDLSGSGEHSPDCLYLRAKRLVEDAS